MEESRTELQPAVELAQYLPLSIRPRVDERGVTNNWSPRLAALLLDVAEMLGEASGVARVGVLARSIATTVAPRSERGTLAAPSDTRVLADIRRAAAALQGGTPRTRIRTAGLVLADAYEIAGLTQRQLRVDAVLSGAVALARSAGAPLPIRAVIRDRRLVASDAGWEFGTGADLRGTAAELVLFLYGRGPVPRG